MCYVLSSWPFCFKVHNYSFRYVTQKQITIPGILLGSTKSEPLGIESFLTIDEGTAAAPGPGHYSPSINLSTRQQTRSSLIEQQKEVLWDAAKTTNQKLFGCLANKNVFFFRPNTISGIAFR